MRQCLVVFFKETFLITDAEVFNSKVIFNLEVFFVNK